MTERVGRIIKSGMVRHDGVKQISYQPEGHCDSSVMPTAQIIGQEDGVAIIQVRCSCGQEIQLRCAQSMPVPA